MLMSRQQHEHASWPGPADVMFTLLTRCEHGTRLIQVEHPDDSITTYVYNGDGQKVEQDDGVDVTKYVYDGNNLLQERDTGAAQAEFTYQPLPQANLVSQNREDEASFYHFDGIHNTSELTDDTGTVTDEYRFDAFGLDKGATGGTPNANTYKGEFLAYSRDPNAGPETTYSLTFRNYQAETGQFNSVDPAEDDLNTYRYVKNNPVNAEDPSGLESPWWAFARSLFVEQPYETASTLIGGAYEILKYQGPIEGSQSLWAAHHDVNVVPLGERWYQKASNVSGETNIGDTAGFEVLYLPYAAVEDLLGVHQLVEGVSGYDLADYREIQGLERAQRTLTGISGVSLNAAAALHTVNVNPTLWGGSPPVLELPPNPQLQEIGAIRAEDLITSTRATLRENITRNYFGQGETVTPPVNPTPKKIHIDIGGEGRYLDAINVNPSSVTSTTGAPGRPIPNRIAGVGETLSQANQSVDLITVENTPIRSGASAEIARVIKPGGEIRLVHPAQYAKIVHQQVIQALPKGATFTQTTIGTGDAAMTTTIINLP